MLLLAELDRRLGQEVDDVSSKVGLSLLVASFKGWLIKMISIFERVDHDRFGVAVEGRAGDSVVGEDARSGS